jgi:transposase-like protein
MTERRKYSQELKAEAIKMVLEQGLTHTEVSQRLSIPKGTIGN